MREKLIELLLQEDGICKLDECKDCNANGSCYYYRAADRIIAHGVVVSKIETTTRWIPVTERLPEKEGRYLCVVRIGKSGAVYVQVMNGDSYGFSLNHIYTDDVTHWMPLPEPPKGE